MLSKAEFFQMQKHKLYKMSEGETKTGLEKLLKKLQMLPSDEWDSWFATYNSEREKRRHA